MPVLKFSGSFVLSKSFFKRVDFKKKTNCKHSLLRHLKVYHRPFVYDFPILKDDAYVSNELKL